MALPTATAPHSGPVDQPGEGAYLWARSAIARSATTRSNYVSIQNTIDWIIRDGAGNITGTTDLVGLILQGTLHISQAINDEPDTCSFTLKPQPAGTALPRVGQEIRVAWASGPAAGVTLFHGYILTTQSDWRLGNCQPPWVAVQCQDPMWRFDARIVTYRFPAQSVTASIATLVQYFCNLDPTVVHPFDFSLAAVQAGMPAIPAFDVVNQRPSTVMRTLLASVGGGFYLEGLVLHAWANSASEPNQTDPTPLTMGLSTLHSFRYTEDATQLRRGVLVEGRRTETLIGIPTIDARSGYSAIGIPLGDASWFDPAFGVDYDHLVRMGAQWVRLQNPVSVTAAGKNPPQTRLRVAFTPGAGSLLCDPMTPLPPVQGWVRIGNQYAAYQAIGSDASGVSLILASSIHPYGQLTAPMAVGETVEWVDCVMEVYPHALQWIDRTLRSDVVLTQPASTPIVTLAVAQAAIDGWPPLEGFVQDGRYSYAGAQARADADLAAFRDPLVTVEWETDDLNAVPGREQVIALSSAVVVPPINQTVTILRVDVSFPLWTLPPRRRCTGGVLKRSSFLDLVVTENN